MFIDVKRAALSAVLTAGLLSGGLAANASAAPPPYKIKIHDRTLAIGARGAGDDLALRLAPGNPQVLQVDVGDDGTVNETIVRSRFDRISIAAGSGDNRVRVDDANGAVTTADPTTINGQDGDDQLIGGAGDETILGGDGNDFVDAGLGADTVDTGAGDDVFIWEPGQGSDRFDGGAGSDSMRFDGSAGSEQFGVSANGSRVRFTRDLGGIVMDLGGVEKIEANVLAGTDTVTVGDLTGTDTSVVEVDLGAVDGVTDQVKVNGTGADDVIRASGTATGVSVRGLSARVDITGAQLAEDKLSIFGLAGNDVVDGSALTADAIRFAADGGAGNDVLRGGAGNDTLAGGDGDDLLVGGPGIDALDGGAGNNVLVQD
jgi:Ca2+-binding RTX toxin-like protein